MSRAWMRVSLDASMICVCPNSKRPWSAGVIVVGIVAAASVTHEAGGNAGGSGDGGGVIGSGGGVGGGAGGGAYGGVRRQQLEL